jgi:hypothetical protein
LVLFRFDFCDNNLLNQYIYNTVGDPNDILTTQPVNYYITSSGFQLSIANTVTNSLLEYKVLILEKEKEKLKQTLQNQIETEEQIGKQLQQKYGDGSIDLEKGEFIPAS